MKISKSCSIMSNSFWPHGPYSPWNSPGQNTGEGSLALLQGISTQGQNPGLRHCRQILETKGKPKNTEAGSLSLLQRIFPTEESPALQADSWPTELSGKPNAGKDWRQKEKGEAEDEMMIDRTSPTQKTRCEFAQTPGESEGQGSGAVLLSIGSLKSQIGLNNWTITNKCMHYLRSF